MQLALCLDTIGELANGLARGIIDAAIRAAISDLDDRGEDGKERTVNIVLHLTKADNGNLVAHVEAAPKLPSLKTPGTHGIATQKNGKSVMLFQALCADDPKQRTIDEAESRED